MISRINRKANRDRRHKRIRTKMHGTAEIPRLAVSKSNRNLTVQIINDDSGETLVSASTLDKEVKVKNKNKEAAKEIGTLIAEKAKKAKIKKVVFDRGGYAYHGVIKEIADAARNAGLEF